jgi:hypothetical protein
MNRISLWLAQIDFKDGVIDLQKTGTSRTGLTAVFAAAGVVAAIVILWAVFIRKKPDESSRRYRYPSSRDAAKEGEKNGNGTAAEPNTRSERRKRRRRKHRPRNPTLSQTGGLPPVRADGYLEDPP